MGWFSVLLLNLPIASSMFLVFILALINNLVDCFWPIIFVSHLPCFCQTKGPTFSVLCDGDYRNLDRGSRPQKTLHSRLQNQNSWQQKTAYSIAVKIQHWSRWALVNQLLTHGILLLIPCFLLDWNCISHLLSRIFLLPSKPDWIRVVTKVLIENGQLPNIDISPSLTCPCPWRDIMN